MLISHARPIFLARVLGSFPFAFLLMALLLVSLPHRSDARTLSLNTIRVATQTPPDEQALSALPNIAPAKFDVAAASLAVTRLGVSAADAGVRATRAARTRVVDKIAGGGVLLSAAVPARNSAVARNIARSHKSANTRVFHTARTVTPVINRAVSAAPAREFVRSVASSRSLSSTRFFDRNAAAAASRLRFSALAASGAGDSGSGRSDIVRTALTYRGVPYRFGGRGRGGIDCSGFTGRVFAETGTSLPRTAAAQFSRGTAVPREQLKQGDLVFFKNTYRSGVSHVGIYVGDGKFVHASSSRGVRVDSLGSSYFARRWAGARRASSSRPAPVIRRG